MIDPGSLLIAALFFLIALQYSSVGHAGASSYLAVMAILDVSPALMRPAALSLNIFVAVIAAVQFYRAKCFSWALFWPFAITSVPMAFLGGLISLQVPMYKTVVGVILLYAAARIFISAKSPAALSIKSPPRLSALLIGAGIGLLSGLTGVGGGIFLSPVLLLMGWADARTTAGVAAVFILVNSISGLDGYLLHFPSLPVQIPLWIASVVCGGAVGSWLGSRYWGNKWLKVVLSGVLILASIKMLFV